jgi:hypothetical protein
MSFGQSRNPTTNAASIVKLCEQKLKASGFIDRRRTTLWRRTNRKFDVLKLDVIPKRRCEKWRVPIGSFSVEPSCLFPFLPRLGHLQSGEALQPERGFGQVRLSVYRGISQRAVDAPNIWWAGDNVSAFELVVKDVLGKIDEEVLPFFSRFEDQEVLLRTFIEEDDAIGREGVWDFGKKESPTRLLYIGFAAIECGEWGLATSSLTACKQKTMAIPKPAGALVQAELLPYLDQGLACADHKRAWSIV